MVEDFPTASICFNARNAVALLQQIAAAGRAKRQELHPKLEMHSGK